MYVRCNQFIDKYPHWVQFSSNPCEVTSLRVNLSHSFWGEIKVLPPVELRLEPLNGSEELIKIVLSCCWRRIVYHVSCYTLRDLRSGGINDSSFDTIWNTWPSSIQLTGDDQGKLSHLPVTIKQSETDPFRKGVTIIMHALGIQEAPLCPVAA